MQKKKNQSIAKPGIESPKTRNKEKQTVCMYQLTQTLPESAQKCIYVTGKHSLVRSDPLGPLAAAHTHTDGREYALL